MKVSLLACMCLAVACTQLLGCGDQGGGREPDPLSAADGDASHAPPNDSDAEVSAEEATRRAYRDEHDGRDGRDGPEPLDGAEAAAGAPPADCADHDGDPSGCGQISFKLKGLGSSCQLLPTASDLTRTPRSVRFDCKPIVRGPNGYDYDALGHITLTGETCEALHTGGPHRVTLVLACGPG